MNRKSKSAKKSNTLLWVLLGCGGLAVIGVVAAAVLLVVFWPFGGGRPLAGVLPAANPAVTKASFDKLDFDETREEVEQIMGPGQVATDADMDRAHPTDQFDQQQSWRALAIGGRVSTWVQWRNGSDALSVGFAQTRLGELSTAKIATFRVGGVSQTMSMVVGGGADLAQARERKQQTQKLLAAPKWVKGPDARKLLVGKWRRENGWLYEFRADGSLRRSGLPGVPDATGKYVVRDDEQVDVTLPALIPGGPDKMKVQTDTMVFRVNRDELSLFARLGDQLFQEGNFRRADGGGKK